MICYFGIKLLVHDFDGEASVPPCIETTGKRAYAGNAHSFELPRHTGAGGFVRSGAIEDDFLIARNFLVLFDSFGQHVEGARDSDSIHCDV